jgi:hypothetical protein
MWNPKTNLQAECIDYCRSRSTVYRAVNNGVVHIPVDPWMTVLGFNKFAPSPPAPQTRLVASE